MYTKVLTVVSVSVAGGRVLVIVMGYEVVIVVAGKIDSSVVV